MRVRFLFVAAALTSLGGCANFKVISQFAEQTHQVTTVVRSEFSELDALCRQQAEQTIVISNLPDDAPLRDCDVFRDSSGRLAAVTLDVLQTYAKALEGLADNKSFDLDADAAVLSGKIAKLPVGPGKHLTEKGAGALTKVLQSLAEIATESRREDAVRRLLQERENLAEAGRILRALFAHDPTAAQPAVRPPYANWVGLISDANRSAYKKLGAPGLQNAEPIRTAELRRASQARTKQLEARQVAKDASGQGAVPEAVVAAIDAWLQALDKFSDDAMKPQPKELLTKIREAGRAAAAARDVVQDGRSQ